MPETHQDMNMSGRLNGLQAKIQEVNKSALNVHCYAHSLNLVLVSTISQNQASQKFFWSTSIYTMSLQEAQRDIIYS